VRLLAVAWPGRGADACWSEASHVNIEDTFRPANANTASVPVGDGPFNPAPQLRPGLAVEARPQEPPR